MSCFKMLQAPDKNSAPRRLGGLNWSTGPVVSVCISRSPLADRLRSPVPRRHNFGLKSGSCDQKRPNDTGSAPAAEPLTALSVNLPAC
jgi:hypothetical protein